MKDVPESSGHKQHYEHLVERLKTADIAVLACRLDLLTTTFGEAEVPFLGARYLISNKGVHRSDGQGLTMVTASALIHYLLRGSTSRPAGTFVSLSELAGPWLKDGSFSKSALEGPITKRFRRRIPELMAKASSIGGRQGGVSGMGSISLIFDLLPNLPLQLIFYDQDNEFPARATLLIDANANRLIDFEALAFLLSIFVHYLTNVKK